MARTKEAPPKASASETGAFGGAISASPNGAVARSLTALNFNDSGGHVNGGLHGAVIDRTQLAEQLKAERVLALTDGKCELAVTTDHHIIHPAIRGALVAESAPKPDGLTLELPRIRANGCELRDVSAQAIEALSRAEIYIRSGELVRVRVDEKGCPSIESVNESSLRGMLARVADFYTVRMRGETPIETTVAPPLDVVRDVLSLGEWPFSPLEGVIESPTMRPDGSILRTYGYDAATRLYLQPLPGFDLPDIPHTPHQSQAQQSLATLRDALCDFPFADDASADNAVAALLTIVARPMISGSTPIFAPDAPQQGTGKTLLACGIAQIAIGEMPELSPEPDDPAEWRKSITSQLSTGRAVVIIDNVTRVLEDGSLAAVATSATWSDRLMGRNDRMIRLPARAVWMVTGNNVRVGGDLVTRVCPIRLDAKTGRPQDRDGFRHPNLAEWIAANRARLLAAALTLCRAWHVAGRPAPICPRSRYSEWRNVIGGILQYSGATSFLQNLAAFADQADTEGPAWEAFILKLRAVFSNSATSPGAIYDRAVIDESLASAMPDDFTGLLGGADDLKTRAKFTQRIGYAFRARVGKRFGDSGARIELAGKAANKLWSFVA